MKKIYSIMLMAGVLFSAVSCVKDDAMQETVHEGAVKFNIGMEDQLSTRASDDEIIADAKVMIYKPAFEGLIREYTYSAMPDVVYLPATAGEDKYRVDVYAGERVKENPALASFDSKSYKGSAEFAVVANEVAESAIEVVAEICNVVTQVSFGDSIAEAFQEGYGLTVGYDANALTYTADKSGQDGYFIIADDAFEPEFNWNFAGTLKKDGSEFKSKGKFVVEQGKRYKMALKYEEKDGTLKLVVTVDKTLDEKNDQIAFVPTSTGISTTKKYDIWASHITLRADVDKNEYDPTKVYFEYRKVGSETWSRSDAATQEKEGVFAKVITGLEPAAEYECQLIVTPYGSTVEAEPISGKNFTTSVAPVVPNNSFEDVDTSGKYPVFYTTGEKWWDSGNAGSGDYGYVICDIDTENKKDGKQSACLQSAYAVIKFAAGNLFSGSFGEVLGTSGGTVYFGRPFVGRPTKVRFWVKGAPAQVTSAGGPTGNEVTTSDYDTNQIKVALGTWDYKVYGGTSESPILVNTTDESTFVDFNTDKSTIAYADLQITTDDGANYTAKINGKDDTATNWNEWKQVTIDLEYRDLTKIPTHIIISGASSMLGDYFAGGKESKLWIDKVELLYDSEVVVKTVKTE